MSYEQAMELVGGDAPAWVLQSIIERQPRTSRYARAATVLLKGKREPTLNRG
jgi:hypothetical protein